MEVSEMEMKQVYEALEKVENGADPFSTFSNAS